MADPRTREFDDSTVECRTSFIRHDMKATTVKRGARETVVRLVCQRCEHVRIVVLDPRGHLIESYAEHYAEDYLVPKGTGRVDNSDVRSEWLKRNRGNGRGHLKAV